MYKTLMGYATDLADFNSTKYKGITYTVDSGVKRILELAFPPVNLSPEQAAKLNEFIEEAKKMGIEVVIHFME